MATAVNLALVVFLFGPSPKVASASLVPVQYEETVGAPVTSCVGDEDETHYCTWTYAFAETITIEGEGQVCAADDTSLLKMTNARDFKGIREAGHVDDLPKASWFNAPFIPRFQWADWKNCQFDAR